MLAFLGYSAQYIATGKVRTPRLQTLHQACQSSLSYHSTGKHTVDMRLPLTMGAALIQASAF